MAGQRDTIEFTVDRQITALTAGPAGPGDVRAPSTWTATAVEAAHGSYAPRPVRELIQAPQWPDEHLPGWRPDQYVAWAGDREPADGLALIDRSGARSFQHGFRTGR
jgi:hypothetical protein